MKRTTFLAGLLFVLFSGCERPLVEPGNQRILWSYSNSEWTSVQPYADDEIAVFVDNGGGVFALDAETGNPVWEQEVPIPPEVRHRRVPNTNVIAFRDLIIVSIWDIYAFDRTTGNERWRYSPPDDFPGYNPLMVDESGRLVAAGRYLYLLDAATGELQWRRDLGEQPFAPVLADGVAYLGTRDMSDDPEAAGHAIAVNANTGELLWKHLIPDAPPPNPWGGGAVGRGGLTDDLFVVAGGNGRVYGLDRELGEPAWEYQGTGPYSAGVVIIDGVVVVGSLSGHAEGIESSTGQAIWRIGSEARSSP